MTKVKKVSPPNSVVLVMDPDLGDVPETMGGRLVAATPSCVAVGCLSEHDGQTSLAIGEDDLVPARMLAFEGAITTPNRHLAICNVLRESYIGIVVAEDSTRVQIWVSDESEPDDIRVIVQPRQL